MLSSHCLAEGFGMTLPLHPNPASCLFTVGGYPVPPPRGQNPRPHLGTASQSTLRWLHCVIAGVQRENGQLQRRHAATRQDAGVFRQNVRMGPKNATQHLATEKGCRSELSGETRERTGTRAKPPHPCTEVTDVVALGKSVTLSREHPTVHSRAHQLS